jgi:hypothetical protein
MLKKPTNNDICKIGLEINQIIHERFLLTTIAITILGVIGGWLSVYTSPKITSANFVKNPVEVGWVVYGILSCFMMILLMLFLYSHILYCKLRIYTTYLRVTGSSNWEWDWWDYRQKKPYFGYRKGQSLVFLLLGVGTMISPLVFAFLLKLSARPYEGLILQGVVFLLYLGCVYLVGFDKLHDPEKSAFINWRELRNSLDLVVKPESHKESRLIKIIRQLLCKFLRLKLVTPE